ncbi:MULTISPECIES: sensor domain-containing diguanylate cyclase [Stenotrophomonas]|uniref:diguanylate cyclase n=1 Tax=Stenotrophomonas nitritireducens TaxID=83617 RepID=A0ABR5NN20_9GAMM|nr:MULTISPECIES: sensor domain-containing diguanylate cyclase [Stenotrophomonas]KQO02262.1 diguanylate cyclase [Stenotrophomonas sp. Leaf70]KRG59941.1 diguanylate cyclase [Stenotrophomonas nitritireducens]
MIKPALPANEAERLAALQRYRILDTPREQEFEDLVTIARTICGTSMGAVTLIDSERQWFKSLQGLEGEQTPRDEAFCAHAILQPTHLTVVEDACQDERFRGNPSVTADPFIRFYAGAPLLSSDGYALGTLCVFDSNPGQLALGQAEALWALSRQVGLMLEMRGLRRRIDLHQGEHDWYEARLAEYYAQLEQQNVELSEQTRTDPLTGLPNRRALSAALAEAIERGADRPPAVAIVDIDHFKQVNDIHGHDEGDRVLVELAGVLRAHFAGRGMAARYGGEEFVILMPDTPLAQAELQCQYLREAVAHLPMGLPVTISIGLAVQHAGESAQETLRRADAALYQAKAQGRDRVVVAG